MDDNVIREKRTIEATKKNLIGSAGKFGRILEAFGEPIIRQGSGFIDTNYLEDPFAEPVRTEYGSTMSGQNGPVMSRDEILDYDDEFIDNEGLLFDGLSRGMHINITYWHASTETKVTYRGYLVYREIAGELHTYAPFPEWEDQIERLYRAAKDKIEKSKVIKEQEIRQIIQRKKHQFWQDLRTKWGV